MKRAILILLLASWLTPAFATLKPAGIFGDNAVIQQGAPVPVWGKAAPGARVTVRFAGQELSATADPTGKWSLTLQPVKADGKAHTMIVTSGGETAEYNNLAIGEVWFASGQSNMAFTMNDGLKDAEAELAGAQYPEIRFRTVESVASPSPADDIAQKAWLVCTPENAKTFSAVAYFFARELHRDKNVPVGVIVSAIGATGIGSWMSRESLLSYPPTRAETLAFDPDTAKWNARVRRCDSLSAASGVVMTSSTAGLDAGVHTLAYNASKWKSTKYPMDIPGMGYPGFWGLVWTRKPFEMTAVQAAKPWTLHLPLIVSDYRAYINGGEIKRGYTSLTDLEYTRIDIPAGELKAGNNLLALRLWVIWSLAVLGDKSTPCFLEAADGERIDLGGSWWHDNTIEPEVYALQDFYWFQPTANYNGMIAPVIPYAIAGFLWYQGEANHPWGESYAQMQPLMTYDWRVRWKLGHIPFLYVQLAAFGDKSATPVAKSDMAEFRDWQTSIQQRCINSWMACAIDIGEEKNVHPRNKQEVGRRLYATYKANVLHEIPIGEGPSFRSARLEDDRIRIAFDHAPNGLQTTDGALPAGFAVSDKKGHWTWAEAVVEGNDILVSVAGVNHPVRVQYAWQGTPPANLYNREGFPALPFNEEITR